MLFVGTALGGRLQDRLGPRPVVLAGGIIYSVGIMLASLVERPGQLWLLVLTYGIMGGFGLGLGYIVPIAMLTKWFPDRRGLITGIAVGGFGAGALITAPVAKRLLDADDVAQVFFVLGIAYLVATVLGGLQFRNPPQGYTVPGWEPGQAKVTGTSRQYTLREAMRTPQWYRLTAILTLNVTLGIALISQAAPAIEDVTGASATTAASLVGFLAVFNGAGRVFWAWLSDTFGRMRVFLTMFALQVVCFALLPSASTLAVFAVLAAIVYLCYGGGFGTMPATAADFFGTKQVGGIYGAMIVGWSIGGVIGPLLIAALRDATDGFSVPFYLLAALALVSAAVPALTRPPAEREPTAPKPASA